MLYDDERAQLVARFLYLVHRARSDPGLRSAALGPDYQYVQRNLALELVRVTEAAALAAGRWLGKASIQLFD